MPVWASKMLRNPFGGALFAFLLYFGVLFGLTFVLCPCIPLMVLRPTWYRRFNDKFVALMPFGASAFLELMYGVKVVITGDEPIQDDVALFIANHRCHFDWMFIWSVMVRYCTPSRLKIVMKDILKYIPGVGWGLQCGVYLFLKRHWEQDEAYLNNVLDYYIDMDYPLQLLIFPEGTNLDSRSQPLSDRFATKNNLPLYKHVLHPRTRGFIHCLEKLHKGRRVDAVYDITVGYDQDYCYKEEDLALGNFPKEVHFNINRYAINDLPTDYSQLEDWLCKRWAEKEERLAKFYKESTPCFAEHEELVLEDSLASDVKKRMFLTMLVFVLLAVGGFFLLYKYVIIRWYFLALVVMFVVQCLVGFGMDKFQLWIHEKIGKKERHIT